MGFRYEIEGRVVTIIAEGDYGLADVRATLAAALEDPRFDSPMWLFADARQSGANPPISEVRETAEYLQSVRHRFSEDWILLVSGSLRYGLARMLGLLVDAGGIKLHVFRDDTKAREALSSLGAA